MTGKLKIIRLLGNPKPQKKKKKAARKAPLKRSRKRLRDPAQGNARYVVRVLAKRSGSYYQAWWTGSKFQSQKNKARRYIGEGAAASGVKTAAARAPKYSALVEAVRV